jgi:quinolinate synthase
LCPHMRRNTLAKILRSLQTFEDEITVDAGVAERARRSLQRMIDLPAAVR